MQSKCLYSKFPLSSVSRGLSMSHNTQYKCFSLNVQSNALKKELVYTYS